MKRLAIFSTLILCVVCAVQKSSPGGASAGSPSGGSQPPTASQQTSYMYYYRYYCQGYNPYVRQGKVYQCHKFAPCPKFPYPYKCQDFYSDNLGICCPKLFGENGFVFPMQNSRMSFGQPSVPV